MKLSNYQIIKLIIVFVFCLLVLHPSVYATNVSSDNYQIQIDSLDVTDTKHKVSPQKESLSPSLKLKDKSPEIAGQATSGEYEQDGYLMRAGFPYNKIINPFSFAISDLSIEFDSLIPDNPNTQTNTLIVSGNSYSVVAFENYPLRSLDNPLVNIPDTTCNGGLQTCDETIAKVWDNNSTYGFGFNMSGDDISTDFINHNYYRQFANKAIKELPQVVMSSNQADQDKNATVTYKVNISPLQVDNQYENMITFVATPGY